MQSAERGVRSAEHGRQPAGRLFRSSARLTALCALHSAVCILSGCTWLDKVRGRSDVAATGEVPRVSAERLVARLNQQAAVVKVVRYPDVAITLDGPDVPAAGESLANSSLIAAQPRLFLLKAGKNIRSDLLQVGSNEREFWLVGDVPGQDKLFLVCAHEDFPKAAAKLPVPFDPEWALLALGMTGTDPDPARYRPVVTDDRLRTYTLSREATTPGGRKVEHHTVFAADEPTGTQPLVRQHRITEPGGKKVIARADVTSVYRVPGTNGAEVPTDLTLAWPEQKFTMRLRMRNPEVNEALDPARTRELFTRPEVRGVTPVNLADASFRPAVYRGTGPAEPRRGLFGWRRD